MRLILPIIALFTLCFHSFDPVFASDCEKALFGWDTKTGRHIQGTLANEGGWVNDPSDSGRETYRGIARKFNPEWKGWPIIDSAKASLGSQPSFASKAYYRYAKQLNGILAKNSTLHSMVVSFYHDGQWLQVHGDEFISQYIAYKANDVLVNQGNSKDFMLTVNQKSHNMIASGLHITSEAVKWVNDNTKVKEVREAFIDRFILNVIQTYLLIEDHTPKDEKFLGTWVQRSEDDE